MLTLINGRYHLWQRCQSFLYIKTVVHNMKKLKKLCEESPKFKKRIIDIVLRGKFDGSQDENKKQLVGLVNKQNR